MIETKKATYWGVKLFCSYLSHLYFNSTNRECSAHSLEKSDFLWSVCVRSVGLTSPAGSPSNRGIEDLAWEGVWLRGLDRVPLLFGSIPHTDWCLFSSLSFLLRSICFWKSATVFRRSLPSTSEGGMTMLQSKNSLIPFRRSCLSSAK